MLIGAHVREDDPIVAAAERGAEIVQIFLADPQGWKKPPAHPQAEALRAGDLAVVRPLAVRGERRVAQQPHPHPVPQAPHPARRGRRGDRGDRAGRARRARHAGRRRGDRRRQLAQVPRPAGGRGRVRRADPDREHRRRRQRDGPALRRAGPAVGRGRRVRRGLLPRHLPRLRRRARTSSTSSTGSARSPAASTSCTPTTAATSSTRRATGTPTSATARIDPDQLAAVCAAAGAPVVVETPAEGQAADIAFLRERLTGGAVAAGKGSPGPRRDP